MNILVLFKIYYKMLQKVYKLLIANNNCFLGVHGLCFYIVNILRALDHN